VVDGIFVFEVVQTRDGEASRRGLGGVHGVVERLGLQCLLEVGDEGLGTFRCDLLVVVSAKEGAAVDGIELSKNFVDADDWPGWILVGSGEDVQPG
jgi:hypothetical protein